MTETKIINPELMLKAAKMARLDRQWEIAFGRVVINLKIDEGMSCSFNPLTSNSDAWALELALKKSGWSFGPSKFPERGAFRATHIAWTTQWDDSDTMLLLKCVSAQTGIPLHAKGVEG